VYSMVQRREKKKDSRYIQEASAPAAVTVYQTCNIMYICNTAHARDVRVIFDGSFGQVMLFADGLFMYTCRHVPTCQPITCQLHSDYLLLVLP